MKSFSKRNKSLWSGFACALLPFFFLMAGIGASSCKMTEEGIVTSSDDTENPVLSTFHQVSETCINLGFSEKVSLSNLEVRTPTDENGGQPVLPSERIKVDEPAEDAGNPGDEGFVVGITFAQDSPLLAGKEYFLAGVAHDQAGNSLSFRVPFHGFNSEVAGVVLSEVRSGYDKPKVEYVELYVHSPGNLAGVSLYFTNKDFEYVFPAAKVSAGDYIVLHMRALEGETGRVDEVGDDLNASTAPDSCADVRDFWASVTSRIVGHNDVIVLRERQNGKIVDALLYAQSGISDAVAKRLTPVAQQMVDEGVWSGSTDFSTWASGEELTDKATTRSLSRQNIAAVVDAKKEGSPVIVGNSTDWMVVKGATPGQENSTDKYVKSK